MKDTTQYRTRFALQKMTDLRIFSGFQKKKKADAMKHDSNARVTCSDIFFLEKEPAYPGVR